MKQIHNTHITSYSYSTPGIYDIQSIRKTTDNDYRLSLVVEVAEIVVDYSGR